MYDDVRYSLSAEVIERHAEAWRAIGAPGPFWSGGARVRMVAEARAAMTCELCAQRKAALSPFAVEGEHDPADGPTGFDLPPALIDMIHRLRTDPGRYTRTVFDNVLAAGLSREQYIETVGVVNASVIVDTMHASLGLPLPELPTPEAGGPTGQPAPDVVDGGAWVPLTRADDRTATVTGLPGAPNIARSMGCVPAAVALFFTAFRGHYALRDIPLAVSQPQAEFIASRVSALNQCFY